MKKKSVKRKISIDEGRESDQERKRCWKIGLSKISNTPEPAETSNHKKPTWEAGTTDLRRQKARPKAMRVLQSPGTGQEQKRYRNLLE